MNKWDAVIFSVFMICLSTVLIVLGITGHLDH